MQDAYLGHITIATQKGCIVATRNKVETIGPVPHKKKVKDFEKYGIDNILIMIITKRA